MKGSKTKLGEIKVEGKKSVLEGVPKVYRP
jgi:hypothetical protein